MNSEIDYKKAYANPKSPESILLFKKCKEDFEKGDLESAKYLSRMYFEGIGTESNIDLAINTLKKIVNDSVPWTKREYCMLLSEISNKLQKEMFEGYLYLAENGDSRSMGLVARAYRDSKGTPKNIKKSEFWFRKSYERGIIWAGLDLIDLLLESEETKKQKEAFKICSTLSDKSYLALAKLGVMYKNGIGTNKDLEKAEELLKCASDSGIVWATFEYIDLNIEMGTEQSRLIAFKYCQHLVEQKNSKSYGYIARMYRYGIGTPKNMEKSIKYYRMASENHIKWAADELKEMLTTI